MTHSVIPANAATLVIEFVPVNRTSDEPRGDFSEIQAVRFQGNRYVHKWRTDEQLDYSMIRPDFVKGWDDFHPKLRALFAGYIVTRCQLAFHHRVTDATKGCERFLRGVRKVVSSGKSLSLKHKLKGFAEIQTDVGFCECGDAVLVDVAASGAPRTHCVHELYGWLDEAAKRMVADLNDLVASGSATPAPSPAHEPQ